MSKVESPEWLTNFVSNYEKLSVDNLELIRKIYHQQVEFQDPAHTLIGLDKLEAYFESLYTNLSECTFVIDNVLQDGDQAAIYWSMTFSHPKLSRGKAISVEGTSLIQGVEDKVIKHRDYVDFGAMLYEHVPVIGHAIRFLKNRLSS
jgi:hypothetical protein